MIKVPFTARYGKNELIIQANGEEIRLPFVLKYGVNVVPFSYGGKIYEFRFVGKYGKSDLTFPITVHDTIYLDNAIGLSNLYKDIFTIINQIPESQTISTKIAWKKHALAHCGKRDGLYDKSSGQMIYKASTWTAYVYDWQRYKNPLWTSGGYYALSDSEKDNFFTVDAGDLLIFADIPEAAPKSIAEFNALRDKYKTCGGIVTGCEAYINYKPNGKPWKTNHIEVIRS